MLRELDDDVDLMVVGGASGADGARYLDQVQKDIARHGLGARVRFVDPQPHHALGTYYRAADVCVVPSRSESFGLVALEAAACGTPVVAAAVGGLRSIVEHGRTGFLVEGRDPEIYAAYVDELLSLPDAGRRGRRRRGRAGRRLHLVDRGGSVSAACMPIWFRRARRYSALRDQPSPSTYHGLMVHERLDDAEIEAVADRVDRWLAAQKYEHPLVAEAQRVPGEVPRWYVRLRGEQKDAIAIWFTLRERTLHYESYVLPAPEENHAAFYEQLLAPQPEAVRADVRHRRRRWGLPRRAAVGGRSR